MTRNATTTARRSLSIGRVRAFVVGEIKPNCIDLGKKLAIFDLLYLVISFIFIAVRVTGSYRSLN